MVKVISTDNNKIKNKTFITKYDRKNLFSKRLRNNFNFILRFKHFFRVINKFIINFYYCLKISRNFIVANIN